MSAADDLRAMLEDADGLVRAVGSGRRRGRAPRWRRVELRYVDLKAGRHLQVTSYDATQAHVANHPLGDPAREAVAGLLVEPFANWHVETATHVHQARATKRGDLLLHSRQREAPVAAHRGHDRDRERLIPADDPVLKVLGISGRDGRVKPSRQAKYRQVEEFCRLLDAALAEAIAAGRLRRPSAEDPLRIVDLGCGNAYLTFAAHRLLAGARGLPVRLIGVDVKEQSRHHNERVAAELGADARFVVGTIAEADLTEVLDGARPDVVLALHACDTATDEALARAVAWRAPLILAAPCCHHDIAAQLRAASAPTPYRMLTRDGILRERFADTLTDALRAELLRARGYRVDVVEFVESAHTPRNTLLRAVRTRGGSGTAAGSEYDDLVAAWQVHPRLADLLPRTMDVHD